MKVRNMATPKEKEKVKMQKKFFCSGGGGGGVGKGGITQKKKIHNKVRHILVVAL